MWITVPATTKGAHREFRGTAECSGAYHEGHMTWVAPSRRPRPFSTLSSFDPPAASRTGPLIAQLT